MGTQKQDLSVHGYEQDVKGMLHPMARGKKILIGLIIAVLAMPVGRVAATGMVEELASKIVSKNDTNDEKMFKIEKWVQDNIKYVSDIELYGREDAAYLPAVTIRKGKADCEDGAFLTQALAAYAGIPLDRVRTLFGRFGTPEGVKGHAWTVYMRESDNEWVVADWTDKKSKSPMRQRTPLSRDNLYSRIKLFAYLVIANTRPLKANFIRGEFPGR